MSCNHQRYVQMDLRPMDFAMALTNSPNCQIHLDDFRQQARQVRPLTRARARGGMRVRGRSRGGAPEVPPERRDHVVGARWMMMDLMQIIIIISI